MDIKKYIESGILEQYVLGLTSAIERQEVERNIMQYPKIKKEVEAIEFAMENYAEALKVKAPIALEASIIDRINNEEPPQPPTSTDNKINTDKPIDNWGTYLMLALVVTSMGIAGWFYNDSSTKLEKANENFIELQEDCDEQLELVRDLRRQLSILREYENERVIMKGTDNAPGAIANVIYNSETQKTYLDVINLPETAEDKQYQLWAIVDGTPVDMGVFNSPIDKDTVLQEVPYIENPQAFAVTLEKRGGSPTPTLEEMVVVGNVGQG